MVVPKYIFTVPGLGSGRPRAVLLRPAAELPLRWRSTYQPPGALIPVDAEVLVNVFDKILEDHKEIRSMFEKARSKATSDLDASVKAFHELHDELISHHEAEEHTVFKPLVESEKTKSITQEAIEEHTSIDEYLAKVKQSHKSERWEAKLSVLKELVDHHLQEEEESLIPKGREVLNEEQQTSLGEEFEKEHKKQLEKLKG